MKHSTALALVLITIPTIVEAHAVRRDPTPPGALQVRVGGFHPAAAGELWADNESTFDFDRADLTGAFVGVSYVASVVKHLDVGVNADFYNRTVPSAYRDYVDGFGLPILHDASLRTVPVSVDLRLRTAGARRTPGPAAYIGAGAGVTFWEYEETGDFLDFEFDPPEIFADRFRDNGNAFAVHVMGGVEIPVGRRVGVTLEVRRSWADDVLRDDFEGLGRIGLGGTSASVGASFRF